MFALLVIKEILMILVLLVLFVYGVTGTVVAYRQNKNVNQLKDIVLDTEKLSNEIIGKKR